MKLEMVIGLEIHVQLNTKSKLYSRADNDAFGANPNTRINEVDLGFPGVLPVLNAAAVQKSARAVAALNGEIQPFSKFDRKNYFYPDLPMGYQITQFDKPIGLGGFVEINVDGQKKKIGITRLHLENDAGKMTHTGDKSYLDYNRAGSPLIEIVTEPDMRNAEEAQAFAKEIQKIVRFANVSDADMEKGMMRFDASISLRPVGENKLYTRTEIKNLNSFTSLYKAILFEQKRQTDLWETGNAPSQETTRGWNEGLGETLLMRTKESADDYRYFPEPDLPPITFTEEEICAIKKSVPELSAQKMERYMTEWGISEAEALKLTESVDLTNFFEAIVAQAPCPKKSASYFLSVVLADTEWKKSCITPQGIADALHLLEENKISASGTKKLIKALMNEEKSAEELMKELGLEQVSDTGAIEAWVDEVLAENEKAVADVKNGEMKVVGFLVGQIMKKSRGSANPGMIQSLLKEKLGL